MFVSQTASAERTHEDQRTFECVQCAYAETGFVQFS